MWFAASFFLLIFLCPFPGHSQTVNVALQKPVEAMYTCGLFGKESYNTLKDATDSVASRTRRSCVDAREPGANRPDLVAKSPSYPASNMVDGDIDTWWQSTSRSRIYHYGTAFTGERSQELEAQITLDLQQEFLAERIIIQMSYALTPQRIVIHKSFDGIEYVPWVYATSNLDWCSTIFNVNMASIPDTLNGTVCVSYPADDLPPGDTISLNFVGVPGALKEWSRIRFIKIKFYDMLFIAPFNALANSYNHYAVAELTVMAECPCNALQTGCVVSNVTGMYECVCGGNTRGRYCETCQPLFNQYKFEYGKPCTECNCHDHATNCFYEEAVEIARESLDLSNQKAGGGVCIDCQHNTDGNNCEKCVAMYFRPANVLQTSPGACVPCGCNRSGSTVNPDTNLMDCVMNNDVVRLDGKLPGECFCKANVQGIKCGACKPQFFNLQQSNPNGCTACGCYTPGTVGASEMCTSDALGQCTCKANVKSRACDECKDGFYGLSGDDPNGCTPCGCDVGGSLNQICNKLSGQCLCRSNNIVGRTCNSVKDQFYYPSPHSIATEFEDAFGEVLWKRDDQLAGFSGDGYAVLSPGGGISSLLQVPEETTLSLNFTSIIVYSGSGGGSINITVGGQINTFLDMILPPCNQVWCQANSAESETLRLTPGPNLLTVTVISGDLLLDKLVAFPIEFLNPTRVLSSPLPSGCDLLNNVRPTVPSLLAACDAATFSLTMYYWSSPLACNCDITGSTSSSCKVNGGQCPCRPGVVGRRCDKCSPDHYSFGPTGCVECSCDAFSTSCDQVTGQCECPDNTFGRQCQFCLPNHWDWHQTQGCKSCECNDIGSTSLQCNLISGVCDCKPGVEGDNCDVCQDGFHSLGVQGCLPCACNSDGSEGNVCNKTTGQCPCKSNVEGVKCSVCKRGTFGLGTSAALGCQDCVCMGITGECSASDVRLSSQRYPLSVRNGAVAVPNLQLSNQDGTANSLPVQVTTDLPTALTIAPTAANQRLFWKMPNSFSSNLLKLYGTDLTFTVNYVIVDGSVFTTHEVLLLTGNTVGLRYQTATVLQGSDTTLTVALRESRWTKEVGGGPVARAEFLKYLASSDAVLVPASFSTGSFTARLSSLSFNVENSVGTVNTAAEKCVCGVEYTGGSCQDCALGYKRANVSTSDFLGVCVPCECNGHSILCDADTGVCENCLDDTTGNSCQTCKVGFYGDANGGTSSDCTACPCFQPRVINATCHANATDNSVKCDFCREGYIGDLCDSCDNLYYGNPATPGGTCSPCDCNGNTDSCDSVSGLCDSCGFNTTGDNCERCITGFYGNASNQACKECGCVPEQSISTVCDAESGQCPCVAGVGGRTCSFCQLGFWGLESAEFVGCRACGCVEAGSTSVQCDNSTGVCSCRPNTSGDLCDTCDDGYFGLPTQPCTACGCDTTGTVPGQQCDKSNGQCNCQPGVGGRQCDQCDAFFVNFTSSGCSECGQCQKSLGSDITNLETRAAAVLNTAGVVEGVQEQDVRLQSLTMQLNTSLVSLGLSNTETTSATEILSNMTETRNTLVSAYDTLQNQAVALETETAQLHSKSQTEYNRQRQMSERTTKLTQDCNAFETTLENYINIATQYSNQASQYADADSDSGTNTLSFDPEVAQAQAVLTKVQDSASMEATRATVIAQSQQLITLNDTVSLQYAELQGQATTLSDLSTTVTEIAALLATADYDLDDAQDYKTQADELVEAVDTILTNTEEANTEARSALNAARAAVRNTNSVLNGDARTVMTGEDYVPFPTGAANFITASQLLLNRLSSLTGFIGVATPTVVQAEAVLPGLEVTLNAVNSTFLTIPEVATEAVLAINNFEEVIADLGNSITMASDANDLLGAIRTNVSGGAFEARRQEYEQEKTDAEALRSEVSALELQPQALLSSIQSATSRLNNEPSLWTQVDTVVDQMTSASNALNTRLQENTLDEQLRSASGLVEEAGTIATTVAKSTGNQDAVLTQKEEEVTRTEQSISDIQGLEQSVSARLTVQNQRRTTLQNNIDQAKTLSQNARTTSQQIDEKIRQLESKLASAETLLSQLRQPLTFDGSLGLTFSNPSSTNEHLYDEISLEVRKPGTVSDGVMFFVDDPNTVDELQIGLKDGKVYFQYATETSPIVLESPAEICAECWVRVDATRYGQVGHLHVTALSNLGSVSTSTPATVTDTSATISLTSNIYVGNIDADKQTTKVANRQFTGCLHNVEYQGELLNLWTTAVATSASATCCSHPPSQPDLTLIPGSSFSGLGYLVLTTPTAQGQPVLMSEINQINLEFRTYSTSATMFLVQNSDATGYVSISLLEGSVIWEILTEGQLLRTQVQGQFNTGQWVQVSAEKADTSLTLSVKFTASSNPPTVSVITFGQLDLTPFDNKNYILGAESDPLVEGYAPTGNNFAGCIRNLAVRTPNVASQPISLTDNVVGVEAVSSKGCIDEIVNGIRFTSDTAHAQFSPVPALEQLLTLEIQFVTEKSSVILVYISEPGLSRFLYLSVFGGNVLLVYKQDTTRTLLASGQYVSDGQLHTVHLSMTTFRVTMQVDGVYFEESSATLSNQHLIFAPAATLFLGGVPEGFAFPSEAPVRSSLVGGMTILAINGLYDQLSFINSLAIEGLSLAGIPAPPSSAPAPPVADVTTPLETCPVPPVPARIALSEGFVLDGSHVVSWTQLAPTDNPVSYIAASFQLSIGFTAYKTDGVLVYIADSLVNPTNYFTVYFLDGAINVKMKSSLGEDLAFALTKKYNTGTRYQLVVIRINDYVAATIGTEGDFATSNKDSEVASTLNIDFSRSLYLGGLGSNDLPSSPLPTQLKQAGRTNFAGAVYTVTLSNEPQRDNFITFPVAKLDRSTAPAVPQLVRYGVSLVGGDTNSFLGLGNVATAQSVKVDIKLTTSSASGLIFLLYQTSPSLYFIAVDVHQNKLRLHLPATYSGLTAPVMLTLDDETNICDSQPHAVIVNIADGAVTTTVDGNLRSRQAIPVSHAVRTMETAQFLVAGLAGPKPATLPDALQTDSLTACITSVARQFGAISQTYDPTQFASSSAGLSFGCPY